MKSGFSGVVPWLLVAAGCASGPAPADPGERARLALQRAAAAESAGFQSREIGEFGGMAGMDLEPRPVEIDGGWSGDLLWAKPSGQQVMRRHGRLVAETKRGWRLRDATLPNGKPVPFLPEPKLLFTMLAELPPEECAVVRTEAGKVGELPVTIVTWQPRGPGAEDLLDAGVLPTPPGGAPSGMFARVGARAPRTTRELTLAIHVDDGGTLRRLGAHVLERQPMPRQGAVRVWETSSDGTVTEFDPAAEAAIVAGAVEWIGGLPRRGLARIENEVTWSIDLSPVAPPAPALDPSARAALGF